jgi:hemoglobin-like flavoprotein
MTPDQIDTVHRVIAMIGQHPEFASRFYGRLFEVAPATNAMFGDIEAQQQKLTDELSSMVELLGDLGALDARARALGARHRGYGVKSAHYRVARTTMIETIRDVVGPEFGPTEEDAWSRATSLITELMQSGASSVE